MDPTGNDNEPTRVENAGTLAALEDLDLPDHPAIDDATLQIIVNRLFEKTKPLFPDIVKSALPDIVKPLLPDLVDKAVRKYIPTFLRDFGEGADNGRAALLKIIEPLLSDLVHKAVEEFNPTRDLGKRADNSRAVVTANSATVLRSASNRRALGGDNDDEGADNAPPVLSSAMVPVHHGTSLRDGLRPPRKRRTLREENGDEEANNSPAVARMPTRSMKKKSRKGI